MDVDEKAAQGAFWYKYMVSGGTSDGRSAMKVKVRVGYQASVCHHSCCG